MMLGEDDGEGATLSCGCGYLPRLSTLVNQSMGLAGCL